MEGAIAWLGSRLGRQWVKKQSAIGEESMKVGQEWGQKIAMDVMAELNK
jgi:hypothetical protein